MTVMLALDENQGTFFNHRRQSMDRLLRQRVLALSHGENLWMSPYSLSQFEPSELEGNSVQGGEDFLTSARSGDFYFVEGQDLLSIENRISTLILFHWNRSYPADRRLDLDLCRWTLISREDFPGHSHETITQEVYRRV